MENKTSQILARLDHTAQQPLRLPLNEAVILPTSKAGDQRRPST